MTDQGIQYCDITIPIPILAIRKMWDWFKTKKADSGSLTSAWLEKASLTFWCFMGRQCLERCDILTPSVSQICGRFVLRDDFDTDLYSCFFKILPAEVVFTNAIWVSILHKGIKRFIQEMVGIPVQAGPAIFCLVYSSSICRGVLFIAIIWSCRKTVLIGKWLLCCSLPKVVPLLSLPFLHSFYGGSEEPTGPRNFVPYCTQARN